MKNKKDLLILLNIFGSHGNERHQTQHYIQTLLDVFAEIQKTPQHSFRVVVSACMTKDSIIDTIKEKFGDHVHVIRYNDRYSCQVTANKTILKSIEHFNEEYEGYLYISSGLFFEHQKWGDRKIFARLIERLYSGLYGIIELQVGQDHGYHFLGHGPKDWYKKINFNYDYVIPPGNHCNFHIAAIHKNQKDFYGVPISDIHGLCGMESTLGYCCAALRQQHLLMGNSIITHVEKYDTLLTAHNLHDPHNRQPDGEEDRKELPPIIGTEGKDPCRDLLWGRKKEDIESDIEAAQTGVGYYPGRECNNEPDWNGERLVQDFQQYDNQHLSINPKMKDVVKRLFFTNKKELDYDDIKCDVI